MSTCGLYKNAVRGDGIEHGYWLRARAEGGFVGTCRAGMGRERCGGYLRPLEPDWQRKNWDYEAECVTCGQTVMSPGGRVLRNSSRHGEMPPDWWEERLDRLKGGATA